MYYVINCSCGRGWKKNSNFIVIINFLKISHFQIIVFFLTVCNYPTLNARFCLTLQGGMEINDIKGSCINPLSLYCPQIVVVPILDFSSQGRHSPGRLTCIHTLSTVIPINIFPTFLSFFHTHRCYRHAYSSMEGQTKQQ